LQRKVFHEGSDKAPAVPAAAKSHAKWCVGKQAWLDTHATPLMIGTRAVTQFTKFKGTWVGHMVYNNHSTVDTRLPIDGDYREYDTAPYVPGHRGTDRVVVDRSSRTAWYTSDHYANFTELKL
jgi:hypothetical protein